MKILEFEIEIKGHGTPKELQRQLRTIGNGISWYEPEIIKLKKTTMEEGKLFVNIKVK